jgi:uncharacterized protein (DUF1800 family)
MEVYRIKHLYGRAGFGLDAEVYRRVERSSINKEVELLFSKARKASSKRLERGGTADVFSDSMDKEGLKKRMKEERKMVFIQNVEWLERMANPDESALLEKMTLFWHGHFACESKFSKLAATQLGTLRRHALGNFSDLVKAIARDVSMIRYLNNQQNRKNSPNENFARELMELFTLGRGNYTERDIREAARAFTGWSSNLKGEFVFRRFQHDFEEKTFRGRSGNFDGDDIIDLILEDRQTARFITSKVYRYFVNPSIDERRVEDLATLFYDSGYEIEVLMRAIFESDWFYRAENRGVKIKSPAEFLAGGMRFLRARIEEPLMLFFVQKALGQVLFRPPNVAGWPGGKAWIDNSTLMLRLNLIHHLMENSEISFQLKSQPEVPPLLKRARALKTKMDLAAVEKMLSRREGEELEDLAACLLPDTAKPALDVFAPFIRTKKGKEKIHWAIRSVMSLPEYQLC